MPSNPTQESPADFATKHVGRVLVIRFRRELTLPSFERCTRLIAAARASAAKRLCFIGVIAEGIPPLSAPLRKAVIDATPGMLKDCESLDIALLGGGLLHGLTRTIMRGMIVATRSSSQIFLHGSPEDAVKRLGKCGVEARAAMEPDVL